MQEWVYGDLPSAIGFSTVPWWWPLPILGIAGVPIAFAIARLPGHGGHRPAAGLAKGPPTIPAHLPGVLLAAVAGGGLGGGPRPQAPPAAPWRGGPPGGRSP